MTDSSKTSQKNNIILIILDTHRYDRLGCYGYPRGTSPNLDTFASKATLFENAISPAQWTIPSHASMFTGLPPSVHHTTQANSVLDDRFKTLAEILSCVGYNTIGYCNNPLVGLIHNNLKRGFQEFYNYSGTAPNVPQDFPNSSIYPFQRVWEHMLSLFRKFIDPIQNKFATDPKLLAAATHPFFVPLWSRFVNFKGHTARSIKDVTRFVEGKAIQTETEPYLLFLNLMETHLPFKPPQEYVAKFAPKARKNPTARKFMRLFNNQAMQWLIPLKRPFTELEAQTISELYDAEVAYQDHLLGKLFEQLDRPEIKDNTMVIIAADHGEMLGEHQFMGHGFGVYSELVQVPLMIRMPKQQTGRRVSNPVLTTNLFHTILDAAGIAEVANDENIQAEIQQNSLVADFVNEHDRMEPAPANVISEAYAPNDALLMMERSEPELIEHFHTRETHRAIYSKSAKLYDIDGVCAQLLNLSDQEHAKDEKLQAALSGQLVEFLQACEDHLPDDWQSPTLDLSDPFIEQRLRDLGYMA